MEPTPTAAPAAPAVPVTGAPALDLGSLGAAAAARAAGRTAQRPGFWIAVIVVLTALVWFFFR
jgi:hypothetical protein